MLSKTEVELGSGIDEQLEFAQSLLTVNLSGKELPPIFNIPRFAATISRDLLGNKGINLLKMVKRELPVPPGFIITTTAWHNFVENKNKLSIFTLMAADQQLRELEAETNCLFDDKDEPLFVSVRSGSPVSMPGVMETILNVGLNDKTVHALTQTIGDSAAWEAYFELVNSFGIIIFGINQEEFDSLKMTYLNNLQQTRLNQLPAKTITEMVAVAQELIKSKGFIFPQDPQEQIMMAVEAVFNSWDDKKAIDYKKQFHISNNLGTAAIIQTMVFGNKLTENAGSGVLFTQDPKNLSQEPIVTFIPHTQGTAIVGDSTHPSKKIDDLPETLRAQLQQIIKVFNSDPYWKYKPQDVEYTSDGERVWVLQARDATLSDLASFKQALRYKEDGVLTETETQRYITAKQLRRLLLQTPDLAAEELAIKEGRLIGQGQAIVPGCATAVCVSSIEETNRLIDKEVVLVCRLNISTINKIPPNVVGIAATNGGIGSHTARVAEKYSQNRGGIPIIFGIETNGSIIDGETITIDGYNGRIFKGTIPLSEGSGSLLSLEELEIAKRWLNEKIRNPWKSITEEGEINEFVEQAIQAFTEATKLYQSQKAREIAVFNAMIPKDIRFNYQIKSPQDRSSIRELLHQLLASGCDATIRTCHHPQLAGGGPWVQITKIEDINNLFTNQNFSKYGGYDQIIAPRDGCIVTEVLVGGIPKDKLNPNPEIQHQHCAFTLSCQDEVVVLQIHPFSPQLRAHEDSSTDNIITFTYISYPVEKNDVIRGKNLRGNKDVARLSAVVYHSIFDKWWSDYKLPERLAAIAEVFPHPYYGTPVFEGQARVYPHSESENIRYWISVYGIKVDELKQSNI